MYVAFSKAGSQHKMLSEEMVYQKKTMVCVALVFVWQRSAT